MKKNLLITGGLGYIGSHIASYAISNYNVIILDNKLNDLIHSSLVLNFKIPQKDIHIGDITDSEDLDEIFSNYSIDAVIHCAALKSIPESIEDPESYYFNNVEGTRLLLQKMMEYKVKNLVFSSSCSIYGESNAFVDESTKPSPTNHYSNSKLISEKDINEYEDINSINLRYFNPIGAHESGMLGEVSDAPTPNLVLALNRYSFSKDSNKSFCIFGNDYNTQDGTCVRDFIDINDLSVIHLRYLNELFYGDIKKENINVGTGFGISVMEVLTEYCRVNGVTIPYQVLPRRIGDIESIRSNPYKSNTYFRLEYTLLSDSLKTSYDWYKQVQGVLNNG